MTQSSLTQHTDGLKHHMKTENRKWPSTANRTMSSRRSAVHGPRLLSETKTDWVEKQYVCCPQRHRECINKYILVKVVISRSTLSNTMLAVALVEFFQVRASFA